MAKVEEAFTSNTEHALDSLHATHFIINPYYRMRKGIRQSSFSSEKTQLLPNRDDPLNLHRTKNNTNPPTHEQQVSKEVIRRPEESNGHLPVYRVTKTKFEKSNMRYSDNSPLKSKEKAFRMSPYRQQEFEAYNFAHLNPLEPFERQKKGRAYFYKRKEDKKQDTEQQGSKINDMGPQNETVKKSNVIVQVQQPTETVERAELTLQEMHYEMVKTYQKCKHTTYF